MVFVKIEATEEDCFYVLTWQKLRYFLIKGHKKFLAKHGGVRPRRWDSLHCAISERDLAKYKDKRDLVFGSLR